MIVAQSISGARLKRQICALFIEAVNHLIANMPPDRSSVPLLVLGALSRVVRRRLAQSALRLFNTQ
jgi:hypothetical protein